MTQVTADRIHAAWGDCRIVTSLARIAAETRLTQVESQPECRRGAPGPDASALLARLEQSPYLVQLIGHGYVQHWWLEPQSQPGPSFVSPLHYRLRGG